MTHAQAALDAHKLTVTSVFVPFSQSRNKNDEGPSLNWRVTLLRDGREVLTTDYGAGAGHCPAYGARAVSVDRLRRVSRNEAIRAECENGFEATGLQSSGVALVNRKMPILPSPTDVVYSLVSDSSVLDSGRFEEWASELGYDEDSRKAEKIYRDCLDLALKLRAGLGESVLSELRTAFQDY